MIYIFAGTDQKKKKIAMQKVIGSSESVFLSAETITKEAILSFTRETSLFGDSPVVVVENILSTADVSFTKEELILLSEGSTVFIFLEDKLLKAEETKYKKYATIEHFEAVKEKASPTTNVFAIADAFGRGDKVHTWILYRDAIETGAEPEAISGMFFWKIKQMILASPNSPSYTRLKHISGELVSLYHRSHKGECDFVVGLEQFILASLSK